MKKAVNVYFYNADTKDKLDAIKNSDSPMSEILKQNLNALNILDSEIKKLREKQ